MDLDQTTNDPNWAWCGTLEQAQGARRKHPNTRSFPLVRVNHSKAKR